MNALKGWITILAAALLLATAPFPATANEAGKQSLLKHLFLKGMIRAAKKPLDSFGVGLGYRFPEVNVLGLDISSISIFAALVWSNEELEDKSEIKKRQILLGISYNLDKALKWLK